MNVSNETTEVNQSAEAVDTPSDKKLEVAKAIIESKWFERLGEETLKAFPVLVIPIAIWVAIAVWIARGKRKSSDGTKEVV